MPSSIFPDGGAFTLDGVHSDTWQMYVRSWTNTHQPTPRASTKDIPGRAGKIATQSEISSRLLTLDLGLYADDKPSANDLLRLFSAATSPETGPHTLILQDDQPQYQISVFPSSLGGGQTNVNWAQAPYGHATFTVQLEALDPHWYDTSPSAIPMWDTTSIGSIELLSAGNRATPPEWTIDYPSASNIGVLTGIVLTYAGTSFTYHGTLGVGDELVVDTNLFTVLKNGVNDMANWGGDDFPFVLGTTTGLSPGSPPAAAPVSTIVTWSDTNGIGAHVNVEYTDRWM